MNKVVNYLLLEQETELKFVVIVLSDGEIHFATIPFDPSGRTRHAEIVVKFCKEQGFSPKRDPMKSYKPIYEASKGEIKLSVEGGGIISVDDKARVISSRAGSTDYGWPRRSVVEHCLREAIKGGDFDGYTIEISEVKDA